MARLDQSAAVVGRAFMPESVGNIATLVMTGRI
jgi:hypothetical protein